MSNPTRENAITFHSSLLSMLQLAASSGADEAAAAASSTDGASADNALTPEATKTSEVAKTTASVNTVQSHTGMSLEAKLEAVTKAMFYGALAVWLIGIVLIFVCSSGSEANPGFIVVGIVGVVMMAIGAAMSRGDFGGNVDDDTTTDGTTLIGMDKNSMLTVNLARVVSTLNSFAVAHPQAISTLESIVRIGQSHFPDQTTK